MQNFSLHTHTKGFDGRGSVEEMVEKAKQIGFVKLGISNHFIVHPKIKESVMYSHAQKGGYSAIYSDSFEEVISKFLPHYKEIDTVREKTGFPILKGMEVDFFQYNGWRDGFEKALQILKPDYLIGSAHFVAHENTLLNSHDIAKTQGAEQNALIHRYWANVRSAAQSGYFDFIAHLDLLKKKDLGTSDDWIEEELRTVETLKKYHQKAEINTSALSYKAEPFPEMRMLKMLLDFKVPVLYSDDAHAPDQLGWFYGTVSRIVQKANRNIEALIADKVNQR